MWFFTKAREIPQGQYRPGGRKDRMLKFFQARKDRPVPLPEILSTFRFIAEPMRVIRYLRADWYVIDNIETRKKGIVHSSYVYKGIGDIYPKTRKKTYTQEEYDQAYQRGYDACFAQNVEVE